MIYRTVVLAFVMVLLNAGIARADMISFDVDDYAVGTDISSLLPDVSIEGFEHLQSADSMSYSPATIDTMGCHSELGPDDPCQLKMLNMGAYLTDYYVYLAEDFAPFLSDVGFFYGLSFSFDQAVNHFEFTGFSRHGDHLMLFMFDENDNYLGVQGVTGDDRDPDCKPYHPCDTYSFSADFSGDTVYRIAVGSGASVAYMDSFVYLVPEPPVLLLLSVGLVIIRIFKRK